MKVVITRQPNNYTKCGEIDVDEISGVEWGNCSGGVRVRQSGYSLYGYIPYSMAKDLVNCSGLHDRDGNYARICIPASLNKADYREGYRYLMSEAGEKPSGSVKSNRPEGEGPCRGCILKVLEDNGGKMRRIDLRKIIVNEKGYLESTFRNAMQAMKRDGRIVVDEMHWYKQYVELGPNNNKIQTRYVRQHL